MLLLNKPSRHDFYIFLLLVSLFVFSVAFEYRLVTECKVACEQALYLGATWILNSSSAEGAIPRVPKARVGERSEPLGERSEPAIKIENIALLWYTEVRIFRQLENQNHFLNRLTFLNKHLILPRRFSGYSMKILHIVRRRLGYQIKPGFNKPPIRVWVLRNETFSSECPSLWICPYKTLQQYHKFCFQS